MTDVLFAVFLKLQIALAVGVVVVLLMRRPIAAKFGASAAYRLWLIVPVLLAGSFLPARTVVTTAEADIAMAIGAIESGLAEAPVERSFPKTQKTPRPQPIPATDSAQQRFGPGGVAMASPRTILLSMWGFGILLAASLLYLRQRRFESSLGELSGVQGMEGVLRTDRPDVGPALVGLRDPKIILPADFNTVFTADERRLILSHEQVHKQRGDARANGLSAAIFCLGWFNPLIHIACRRFRLDQELSCDAEVMRLHPGQCRTYGEAMLKSQLRNMESPLACHWVPNHPLKERLQMLALPLPGRAQRLVSTTFIITTLAGAGTLAWASQPATMIEQAADADSGAPLALDPTTEILPPPPMEQAETDRRSGKSVQVEQNFSVRQIDIEDAMAIVSIVPEKRDDYQISISGGFTPKMRVKGRRLVIDGGLPKNRRSCRDTNMKDIPNDRQGLIIQIRAPMQADIEADGIIYADVGPTNGADLSFGGCGKTTIAETRGNLDLSVHSVMDARFGQVDGALDISVHGSSHAVGATVKGPLDLSVHGSSDLTLGDVGGPADISVHGSSSAEVGRIGGPLDVSLHGSSDMKIDEVTGATEASLHGSSELVVGVLRKGLDASLHGSSDIRADKTLAKFVGISATGASRVRLGTGEIEKLEIDANAASGVKFLGHAKTVIADNNAASNIYVETADKVILDDPDPDGRVQVRTADRTYR